MNKELNPCPFCGGEAEVRETVECFGHGDYDKSVFVFCCDCGATSKKYYERICRGRTKERAIEAWNTRKPIDKVVEQLEELRIYEKDGQCPKHDKCSKEPYECTSCYTTTAIEIVKGGAE